jgi:hypothetical protein
MERFGAKNTMIVLKHVVSRNVKNNPRVFLFELQTKPGGVLIQTDHGFAKKNRFLYASKASR